MKRLILFGSICLTLAVVASAMATQAPLARDGGEVLVNYDPRISTMVDSSTPGFGKAPQDTFFLLGGNRPQESYLMTNGPMEDVQSYWSGKFEDQNGNFHWQGWSYSRMAQIPKDRGDRDDENFYFWPGWDVYFVSEHQWSITADKGDHYAAYAAELGSPGVPDWYDATWMNPHPPTTHSRYTDIAPLYQGPGGGAPLVLAGNRSLWIGQYAPDHWNTDPLPWGPGNSVPESWEGKPGFGNRYGWSSWIYQNFDLTGEGDVELLMNYQLHVSCSWDDEDPDYEEIVWVQFYDEAAAEWVELYKHTAETGADPIIPQFGFVLSTFFIEETITQLQHDGNLQLRIRFISNDDATDQRGYFHSYKGAAIFDDINVVISSAATQTELYTSSSDFEALDPTKPDAGDDGPRSFGDWLVFTPIGVGNYTGAYKYPQISIPEGQCFDNMTWIISFANSGQYENFEEPYYVDRRLGDAHTYGPQQCINEHSGGLRNDIPSATMSNFIVSPIMDVAQTTLFGDQYQLRFDVFRHQRHPAPDGDRIFYRYLARGGATIEELERSIWTASSWFFGGPNWMSQHNNVGHWIDSDDKYFQVAVGAHQWSRMGTNGTPAPYFDNIRVPVYDIIGPFINADPVFLAQDNFPVEINLSNKDDVGNRIRFDGAWDLNPRAEATQRIMDSIAVWIDIMRVGYEHDETQPPRVFVALKPNTLWTVPAGADDTGFDREYPSSRGFLNYEYDAGNNIITFEKVLHQATGGFGEPIANRYWFDLDGDGGGDTPPDPVFFPGDILHYYIKAWDVPTVGGPSRESTFPVNLTYFGNFDEAGMYSLDHTVRGLPSVVEGGSKSLEMASEVLWVNAFGNRGGANYWRVALANNGLHEWGSNPGGASPKYYDTYHVHRPDNTGGNHIGGRATLFDIANYKTILFAFGNLGSNVMGTATEEGDIYWNKATCVQLMQAWLDLGNRNVAFMGNDLAYSNSATPIGQGFNTDYLGITFNSQSVVTNVGGQLAPMVRPSPDTGNPVLEPTTAYIAWGDCPVLMLFDDVTPRLGVSTRFAAFAGPGDPPPTDPMWSPYEPAAGIYRSWVPGDGLAPSQIIYTPYDLHYVRGIPCYTYPAGHSARSVLLRDILFKLGNVGSTNTTSVPENRVLTVSNFPNPFNPATTIQLSLPRTGEVSLKVYNVRGELVRTLVNGVLLEGEHEFVWDGTSDRGAQTASGIYFYETRANGEVKVNKMALVK